MQQITNFVLSFHLLINVTNTQNRHNQKIKTQHDSVYMRAHAPPRKAGGSMSEINTIFAVITVIPIGVVVEITTIVISACHCECSVSFRATRMWVGRYSLQYQGGFCVTWVWEPSLLHRCKCPNAVCELCEQISSSKQFLWFKRCFFGDCCVCRYI